MWEAHDGRGVEVDQAMAKLVLVRRLNQRVKVEVKRKGNFVRACSTQHVQFRRGDCKMISRNLHKEWWNLCREDSVGWGSCGVV